MKEERIAEEMLNQSIKELLYSFRKNGGDLLYCVKQLREDFTKAGYTRQPEPCKDKVKAVEDAIQMLKIGEPQLARGVLETLTSGTQEGEG